MPSHVTYMSPQNAPQTLDDDKRRRPGAFASTLR